MVRWNGVSRGIALLVGILLMARPVCAQSGRAARPYRALFGGDASNQRSLHQLDLTVSLNGGVDNGLVTPSAVTPLDSPAAAPDAFEQLYSAGAQLSYAMRGSRVSVAAMGSTTFPYYSTFPDIRELAYGTSANVSYVTTATSVGASGSFAYSPYYAPALDPGSGSVLPGGSLDYASAASPNDTTSAGASLTRRFGRQTSMSLGSTRSGVMFTDEDRSNSSQGVRPASSYRTTSADASVTRRFGRQASTSVGYSRSSTMFVDEDRSNSNQIARLTASRQMSRSITFNGSYDYSEAGYLTSAVPSTSTSHRADVGVGYNRQSSGGRTTTLAFTAGASVTDYQQSPFQEWRGSVSFSQTIGAIWSVGATYRHDLEFQSALQRPVWADVVGATADGRFGSRVKMLLTAYYSGGNQLGTGSQRFDVYSGTARVQAALTEFVAITADYVYYRYNYPAGYDLPAGVPQQMNRQRVQIGASVWLPLVRAGRARGPRPAASQ